jgi:hypothetical protein
LGVVENLYSGTVKHFATQVPVIFQKQPQVTSTITHKAC